MINSSAGGDRPLSPVRSVEERVRKYVCTAEGPMVYTNVMNRNKKLKIALTRGMP